MTDQQQQEFREIWEKPVTRIGMATLLVTAVLSFLPSLYLYVVHGVWLPLPVALKAWGMIAALFGAFYFVEPASYYAILGLSGTYMAFLSGNISNLRLPCSAMAQEVVGVAPGTRESEIISTLGIAGSIITNLVFITLAALAGNWLLSLFPDPVAAAFKNYAVPAIFGAIYGQFAMRYWKIAILALVIAVVMFMVFHAPVWLAILVSVFGTIGVSRLLYVRKMV